MSATAHAFDDDEPRARQRPLATPAPSKRAKSSSAMDLRYGRQGGRRLPLQSDWEQAAAFAAAVAERRVLAAACACQDWWIAPCDLGSPCEACGRPMVEPAEAIEPLPAHGSGEPCPPTCAICHSGWTFTDHAIGPCAVCGEPCRSRDPDGLMRHPQDCETRSEP